MGLVFSHVVHIQPRSKSCRLCCQNRLNEAQLMQIPFSRLGVCARLERLLMQNKDHDAA